MPLKRCMSGGKTGWKWGSSGNCYTGPGAKQKAIKQGIAIEGPDKFRTMARENFSETPITEKDIIEAFLDDGVESE